jgi:transcriptional regulator of acetoin/glycerol metabolism
MNTGNVQQARGAPFSPLAKAVMDSFGEAVIVFDADGRLTYSNARARHLLDNLGNGQSEDAEHLMPVLARLGGRVAPLRVGALTVGEAVYIPGKEGPPSLAEQERRAIVQTLDQTSWRLAETARLLGISRTTLWRRLKTYGLHRDKRGTWSNDQMP